VTTLEERIAKLEALVERQQAIIEQQQRTIEQQAKTIAELERRLAEREGKPPSDGRGGTQPPRQPSGRAPGGQPGHKGNKRDRIPPEKVTRTVECFPAACRGCGAQLPKKADETPHVHQVVDIPPIEPDVTEFRRHRVTCACGVTTCGALPDGTPAGLMGPRLLALVAILTANCHVSRRKVQGLLRDVLGVQISLGALSESEEVVANAVEAPVEEARQSAMAAVVKHADGTTWYRNHAFRALWVLATKGVTVFGLFDSGTASALKKWMGTKGILVSDRGSQLHFWAMHRRQLCWAHLIRKFAWYAEQPGDAGQLGLALVGLAQRVLHEWHRARDGCITRTTFARNIRATRDTIEFLLRAGTRHAAIAGSCANILEHQPALWRFVTEDGVEPTNNHAEQELRGFVLWRKSSLGSQSARGDRFATNLKSVVHTCRKQQRHVLNYLVDAIQAAFSRTSAPSLLAHAP
jgi:transposase